jgi:nucleotide-binding universal stress UspA family protein
MTESSDRPFATIVVGYDGTEPAERALGRAVELARAFGSRLVVADVAAPALTGDAPAGAFGFIPYYTYDPEGSVQTDEVLWRRHRERIESLLATNGVAYEFAGVIGNPATEIVDVAEERGADLIVVGTRDAGLLDRLLTGSVSQGVARRAPCDVLIVRPAPES